MAKQSAPQKTVLTQEFESVAVDVIKPHPRNPRKGNVEVIADSINHNGFYGACVVQRSTNRILAGNHRWLAAKSQGMATVPVLFVDVDDDRALRILLADNRTNDLASYVDSALADILSGLSNESDLDGTGYTEEDLEALIAGLEEESEGSDGGGEGEAPEAKIDKAEELREKWGTELGQLWEIGNHRLLCGDSTNAADVARLMDGKKADAVWTDPPYGVSYIGKTADALTIENDSLDATQLEAFLRKAFAVALENTKPGGAWYVAAPAGPLHHAFSSVLLANGVWRQTLDWIKSSMVLGHSDYHYKHESIFYGWAPGAAHKWYGDRCQVTTLDFLKPSRNELHPTMKPVELIEYCLGNNTKKSDLVFDGFAGSGSTLVACERTGRKGRGIELAPKYAAVILERLSDMGLTPTLLTD